MNTHAAIVYLKFNLLVYLLGIIWCDFSVITILLTFNI